MLTRHTIDVQGFAGWFETSAKENLNINLATETLVNKIIENGQGQLAQEASSGTVNVKSDGGSSQSSCCA